MLRMIILEVDRVEKATLRSKHAQTAEEALVFMLNIGYSAASAGTRDKTFQYAGNVQEVVPKPPPRFVRKDKMTASSSEPLEFPIKTVDIAFTAKPTGKSNKNDTKFVSGTYEPCIVTVISGLTKRTFNLLSSHCGRREYYAIADDTSKLDKTTVIVRNLAHIYTATKQPLR